MTKSIGDKLTEHLQRLTEMARASLSGEIEAFADRITYTTSKRGSVYVTELVGMNRGDIGSIVFDEETNIATYYDENGQELKQRLFQSISRREIENVHIEGFFMSRNSNDMFGF